MKIKNKDVIEIISTMNTLAKEKLPIKLSWRIQTTRKILEPFYETVMNEVEQAKKNKAMKDSDGSLILAKDSSGNDVPGSMMFDRNEVEVLNKEIESLLNEEVEVENISLRIDEFPDDLELSANEMRSLDKIIVA
jgi:hypothetical protein